MLSTLRDQNREKTRLLEQILGP